MKTLSSGPVVMKTLIRTSGDEESHQDLCCEDSLIRTGGDEDSHQDQLVCLTLCGGLCLLPCPGFRPNVPPPEWRTEGGLDVPARPRARRNLHRSG